MDQCSHRSDTSVSRAMVTRFFNYFVALIGEPSRYLVDETSRNYLKKVLRQLKGDSSRTPNLLCLPVGFCERTVPLTDSAPVEPPIKADAPNLPVLFKTRFGLLTPLI